MVDVVASLSRLVTSGVSLRGYIGSRRRKLFSFLKLQISNNSIIATAVIEVRTDAPGGCCDSGLAPTNRAPLGLHRSTKETSTAIDNSDEHGKSHFIYTT